MSTRGRPLAVPGKVAGWPPIRVLVADASADYRGALARLLKDQPVQIVGEVQDTADLSFAIERLRPHVILLDPKLPGVEGLQMVPKLAKTASAPGVILLALVSEDVATLPAGLGEARLLLKEHADRTLVDHIMAAAAAGNAHPAQP